MLLFLWSDVGCCIIVLGVMVVVYFDKNGDCVVVYDKVNFVVMFVGIGGDKM